MKKKELLALPEMKVTKKMEQAVDEDQGCHVSKYRGGSVWTPNNVWYYRVKKTKEILEIDIFTRETIKKHIEYPVYRVFLHDGKYDTYDNFTGRWRTATIEKLQYCDSYQNYPDYYWYGKRGIWIPEKEREILLKFTDNQYGDPMAAVQYWQTQEKNRKELDRIDAEMRLVPELPKDFDEWILTDGLPQYIFYDAGRKVEEGYCTACKQIVKIERPKYNQETVCPHCKRKVIYKSRKKAGNMVDWGYVGLLQKTREGFVYRYFEVKQKYVNGRRTETGCWEIVRQMYDHNFREGNEFEYCRYKYTNTIRWCYKQYYYNYYTKTTEHQVVMYWKNIRRITKGTELEYSALEIFARQKIKFYPENYIKNYRYNRGLEQIVKCGFYKIAEGCLGYGKADYLDLGEKSARKILNLSKEYFKLLWGTDPSPREYEITVEMQEMNIHPKREEIAYLAKVDTKRNFAIYIRHTTIHKMLRYMKENLQSNQELIREYHDYLQMAAGLGYNLNDEYILFPKDMQQRHGQYVEEERERKQEIKRMDDEKKKMELQKTIQKNRWECYEMESDTLLIRLPKDPGEIRKEGNELHHCVSTYIDRMVKGETCIVFIRRKDDPGQSYYTMEVQSGRVVQCRGKYNADMTEEVKEFVTVFKRKKLGAPERMAG